jgi:hypothetical protein
MTQLYVGAKIVQAWHEEKADDFGVHRAGYAVVYADGYRSWCPAEVFDAAYTGVGTDGENAEAVLAAALAAIKDAAAPSLSPKVAKADAKADAKETAATANTANAAANANANATANAKADASAATKATK